MNDNIYQALGLFIDAMRPFLISVLQKHFPNEPWEGLFFSRLAVGYQEKWNMQQQQGIEPKQRIDYNNLSFLVSGFYNDLTEELGNDRNKTRHFSSTIDELKDIRNKCQHFFFY